MDPENTNDKQENSSISSDLIRGHINTIILRTLYDGDKYGYEIINEIEEKSKGQYSLKQPTLYSALKRLEGQDYVTSYWGGVSNGGRRKYFQITDKGRQVVEQNRAEWEYSRTVIDSLISEKDYDFSNPPPVSSVDFNLLKKSTSRVPIIRGEDEEEIELPEDFEAADAVPPSTERQSEETAAPEAESDAAGAVSEEASPAAVQASAAESSSVSQLPDSEDAPEPEQPAPEAEEAPAPEPQSGQPAPEEPQPLTEEEKQRIHENYKVLIGDDSDATSYYYSQVARKNREERTAYDQTVFNDSPDAYADDPYAQQQYAPEQGYGEPYPPQDDYSEEYLQNKAISSELLYSSKPPAERNYKELISRLYDNTHTGRETPPEEQPPVQEEPQAPAKAPAPEQDEAVAPETVRAKTASTIEFYDVEEKAENDGLRITTANGARTRSAAKTVGNTFDKGRALLFAAICTGVIGLIECIINSCLHGVLQTSAAYVVIPYVIVFVGVGVFLFLFFNGYGKNSRKTQSRSYISASLVIFANLVLVICVIASFVILNSEQEISVGLKILKYGVFPAIFAFNLPVFAFFYRYHCNRQ